jgi:hypothetical protein
MRMAVSSFGAVGGFGLLLVAAVAGCDGGGDLGAMTGRQGLQGRDITNVFFWTDRTLAFSRDTADPAQPEPQDVLVWSLDEAAPTVALSGVDWGYPYSWPVWVTGTLMLTGNEYEYIYDVENRQSANLLLDSPSSPGDEPPDSYRGLLTTITARSDGRAIAKLRRGAPQTIIVGRPPDLQTFTIPDGGTVGAMTFVGTDVALLIRHSTASGDVVGVQRLDAASGALTPLVPETPAADWTGVTGFCDDVPPSESCGYFGTIGCGINEPHCADDRPSPCLLLYAKADPDATGKIVLYAHDIAGGTSTRLAGAANDHFVSNQRAHLLTWGSAANSVTSYWNICTDVKGECPFQPGTLSTWRPDGGAVAMFGPQEFLRIVDVAGGTCIDGDPERTYSMYQAQYAPAGDRLMWVAASDAQETTRTLWLADASGQSPVALAGGASIGGTFSPDGQIVYLSHGGESTASLGWIDLRASTPAEQVLSTNRGDIGMLGNQRALFIDHYNAQDTNGELVLVDLATGARQSLARAVANVTVAGGREAEGTNVAYTVRGRAAASRDGLWLTTLPP